MKNKTFIVLFLFVPFGCVNCTSETQKHAPAKTSLDGRWRMTTTNGMGVGCFTLSGNVVTQYDDGCNGSDDKVSTPQPVIRSGKSVIIGFTITNDDGDVLNVAYEAEEQGDGTYRGTSSVFNVLTHKQNTAPMVMVRQ